MKKEVDLKWILSGALLTSVGMAFIWPLTSVYLHDDLHISLSIIGIVLFFNSFASIIGSIAAGFCFDRYDPYSLFLVGGIEAVATLTLLIFFHGWPFYPLALFLLGIGNGWNKTLVNALGATLHQYDGRFVFNMIYFANNLGMVIGTAIVGFIYSFSISLLFVIATILYFIYLLVTILTYAPSRNRTQDTTEKQATPKTKLTKDTRLIVNSFLLVLFFAWIMYNQWVSNLSVYMTGMGIPLSRYSLLWTVNGICIVVSQLLLVRLTEKIKNVMYQIYFGLVMLALSFVLLLFAKDYSYYVIAMVVLSLGETTAFPAIPLMISQLTPNNQTGRYLGLANSFISAGQALGPLIGGLIIDFGSYPVLFIVAIITNLILAGGLATIWKTKKI